MGAFSFFFSRPANKIRRYPPLALPLSLAGSLSPSNFHSDIAMKHKKFPGEMRTGKQRQREETAAETEVGGLGLGERVLVS